jgi:predicted DNA-binding transcriptional regulator AlpA
MHIDKRAGSLLASHASEGPDDEALSTERVAEWLGCSVAFLEIQRGRNTGPHFVRLSPRKVVYLRGEVKAWLRRRTCKSTRDYSRKAASR